MSDAEHTPDGSHDELSPRRTAELTRLINGLDQLDRLLQLPQTPSETDIPFGRFRVQRRLGAGRFGIVFLATDPAVGRQVVVKVPQPAVLADPSMRARFVQEARAAGRLDHPGIVPVFESGVESGLVYLTAGYVDGPTLADWLAGRSELPDPRTAAQLILLVAGAVQHAHDRGVLHCDLKPANVLLDPEGPAEASVPGVGSPRVMDFGLARLLETDPSLTRTFSIAGTPLYMSPEQARGDRRALTARSDVYSLGAILYELLTGRPPHTAASDADVRLRVLTDAVAPPRSIRPAVPRDLEAVCLKCLARSPQGRYPSAAALADDLGNFLAGRPTVARPLLGPAKVALWARRNPVVTVLSALVAVALLVVAAREWAYQRELSTANATLRNALEGERAATLDADQQRHLAIDQSRLLRRRTYLAEVRDAGALIDREFLTDRSVGGWGPEYGEDLRGFEWAYLTRLARATRTWPRQQAPVTVSALTDDGRWCATVAGRDVRIWEVGTGRAVAAWTHDAGLDPRAYLSADGRHAAAMTSKLDAVLVFTPGDPKPHSINVSQTARVVWPVGFAGPDRFVVAEARAARVYEVASGAPVRSFEDNHTDIEAAVVSAGGQELTVCYLKRDHPGYGVRYDVPSGRERGRAEFRAPAHNLMTFADDRHAASASRGTLYVQDLTGAARLASFGLPNWSHGLTLDRLADGRLVAATWPNGTIGVREITLAFWDPRGDRWTTRRVVPPCLVSSVRVRPDGRGMIVGGWDATLHEMDLERPPPEVHWPVAGTAEAWAVAVSPDGRTVVTGGDDAAVRAWDPNTQARVAEWKEHTALVTSVAFAPDGRWFATGGFDGRVVIRDPGAAASRRELVHGPKVNEFKVRALAVSPDGRWIAATGSPGVVSLWDASTGERVHQFKGTTDVIHDLLFSRDSEALLAAPDETELVWFDVGTGRRVRTVPLPGRPSCLARSPAGGGIAVGFETGYILALDAEGGQGSYWEAASPSRLNALAYSPEGRTLAVAADDGSVFLRQASTGAILFPLCRGGPKVHGLAFAPDGSFLAATRHDGRLALWPALPTK